MSHQPIPITPPRSPGHSESSDDDGYLLDDDMNERDEDCVEPPAQSNFSGMLIDPQSSSDGKHQPPLQLLENERVHLQLTGPGGIRLSDFEVRGTLGV